MEFTAPQKRGTLLRRYKRFLADVQLDDGSVLTVHCANSGAMTSCKEPGRPVIVSDSQNPKRKLQHTWEMIQMDETWVGVNTANPNHAVFELIAAQKIPELSGYETPRREIPYGREGRSRIDLLLSDPEGQRPDCYVEVKNTTMRVDDHAAFPDAVTTRGQKHLEELMSVVDGGQRAVMFYFVGRSDCTRFRPADEIDPKYGQLLRQAVAHGVEAIAYRMHFSPSRVTLQERVPIDL